MFDITKIFSEIGKSFTFSIRTEDFEIIVKAPLKEIWLKEGVKIFDITGTIIENLLDETFFKKRREEYGIEFWNEFPVFESEIL